MQNRELAESLMEKIKRPVKLCMLWEWKEDFYRISEEIYKEIPMLASAMTQIQIMEGKLEEAEKYLNYTKKEPRIYNYTKLIMPNLEPQDLLDVVFRIMTQEDGPPPNLTLSASRPSLLNGVKDFSKYGVYLEEHKKEIINVLRSVYGEAATGVYEIALAEHLYQKDECFEALVLIAGTIPFMEDKKDLRCLFAALTLEMYILVMNGQAASTAPLMANIRKRIEQTGSEELSYNMEALEVHAFMYDGQMDKVIHWMKEKAPDEHCDFNMLDTYRYMIKMRCYLIYGKPMALFALAEKLRPLLEKARRKMDVCELQMILAMSLFEQDQKERAFDAIEYALTLAEEYRYDRLIGDEGPKVYRLLNQYRKERGGSPYLERVMEIARKAAVLYPDYLKTQFQEVPKISNAEMQVLRLMAAEKSNAEIAEYLDITLNTVKFHSKNLFKKLMVHSRGQAVKKAREAGIL